MSSAFDEEFGDEFPDKKGMKDKKDMKDAKDLKNLKDKDDKDKEKMKYKEKGKDKDKDKEFKEYKDKEKFKQKDKLKEKEKDDKGLKSLKGEKDKVIKGVHDKKKKKKNRNTRVTWQTYIHKVLKTVHDDDCRLSHQAMSILDSFANDLFERISTEAVRLLRMNNKRTLTSMEIQTASRLVLPGELCKHAIQDGAKAVSKYQHAEGV